MVLAHANAVPCTVGGERGVWEVGSRGWRRRRTGSTMVERKSIINTRMKSSATLPDNNVARNDVLAAEPLDA